MRKLSFIILILLLGCTARVASKEVGINSVEDFDETLQALESESISVCHYISTIDLLLEFNKKHLLLNFWKQQCSPEDELSLRRLEISLTTMLESANGKTVETFIAIEDEKDPKVFFSMLDYSVLHQELVDDSKNIIKYWVKDKEKELVFYFSNYAYLKALHDKGCQVSNVECDLQEYMKRYYEKQLQEKYSYAHVVYNVNLLINEDDYVNAIDWLEEIAFENPNIEGMLLQLYILSGNQGLASEAFNYLVNNFSSLTEQSLSIMAASLRFNFLKKDIHTSNAIIASLLASDSGFKKTDLLNLLISMAKSLNESVNKDILLKLYQENEPHSAFLLANYLYKEGDYSDALVIYRQLSGDGSSFVLSRLGKMYLDGLGTKKDYKQAYFYLTRAIEQGGDWAKYALGIMYRDGKFVEEDKATACQWYQKAVNAEVVWSYKELAKCYMYGYVGEVNLTKAGWYFSKSISAKDVNAYFNIGYYFTEYEETRDLEQAIYWYEKAFNEGQEEVAAHNLFVLYKYKLSDMKSAIPWLLKSVDMGYPDSEIRYADLLLKGEHVELDIREGYRLLKKNADNGVALAQVDLGYAYESGLLLEKDTKKALYWYKKAMANGNVQAINNLATFYRHGIEVKQDLSRAIGLLLEAYRQGNDYAANNLGKIYLYTKDAPIDVKKAIQYFERGAELEFVDSMLSLATIYSKKEKFIDFGLAKRWLEQAYELGSFEAAYRLGQLYRRDRLGGNNIQKAIKWHKRAADGGIFDSNYALGQIYQMELGDKHDYKKAFFNYQVAANNGHYSAQNNLAELHRLGLGTSLNYRKAIELYLSAIELGSSIAMYNMGELYRDGHGVEEDLSTAKSWFEKAKANHFKGADFALALIHINPEHEFYDKDYALKLLRTASKNGDGAASDYLKSYLEDNSK